MFIFRYIINIEKKNYIIIKIIIFLLYHLSLKSATYK